MLSIDFLAQKLISLTSFNSTDKSIENITKEEWLNGKFFSVESIASTLENKMYTGLTHLLEKYTKINRFAQSYDLLVSLRDSFWERYQVSLGYLQTGMVVSALRMEIVHKFKGGKAELLRPEYWLMAKSSHDLASEFQEKNDFYPASGYYLFSAKYSLRFIQSIRNAKELEKSYEKIKSCIDFLKESCEYRKDNYFFEEAAVELAKKVAEYKPKGEQFGRMIKQLITFK